MKDGMPFFSPATPRPGFYQRAKMVLTSAPFGPHETSTRKANEWMNHSNVAPARKPARKFPRHYRRCPVGTKPYFGFGIHTSAMSF